LNAPGRRVRPRAGLAEIGGVQRGGRARQVRAQLRSAHALEIVGFEGGDLDACFIGGLLFGMVQKKDQHEQLAAAKSTGDVLALFTWVAFGGPVLGVLLREIRWPEIIYALLSLTIVRMLPVLVALTGTGMELSKKLFIGWFGPRGLASIVFAVILFDAGLPGRHMLAVTASCTILLSVIAHGVSANPVITALWGGTRAKAAAVTGPS